MFENGNGMTGWGYAPMIIGMVAFWTLLIIGAILLVRIAGRDSSSATHSPKMSSAETVLSHRYARGDVTEEDYVHQMEILRMHLPSQ